jgi:hypothetical protein
VCRLPISVGPFLGEITTASRAATVMISFPVLFDYVGVRLVVRPDVRVQSVRFHGLPDRRRPVSKSGLAERDCRIYMFNFSQSFVFPLEK